MSPSIADKIKVIDQKYLKKEIPEFHVGDTVKMKVKVQEADKVRLHPFEGIVIRKTGRGIRGTFTVRKISFGEGVERIFPLSSPVIDSLKVVQKGVIKRSKLYYLRGRIGKRSKVQAEQQQTQAQAPVPQVPTPA